MTVSLISIMGQRLSMLPAGILWALILTIWSPAAASIDGQLSNKRSAIALSISLAVYQRSTPPAVVPPAGFFTPSQGDASAYAKETLAGKDGDRGASGRTRPANPRNGQGPEEAVYYIDNPETQRWFADQIAKKGEATLSLCMPKGGAGQSLGVGSSGGAYAVTINASGGKCPGGGSATNLNITVLSANTEDTANDTSTPAKPPPSAGEDVLIAIIVIPW